MCGIVGYIGDQNPKDVIVAGLKRLEYRGYDSSGVAILHRGEVKRIRAQGKLAQLESRLQNEEFDGHIGIGHTRWATHGVPSERNAHPHRVAGVSLVHNGIIENYQEIRAELLASGADIQSDTDSELVAHLLARAVMQTKDLTKAVLQILPRLRGAFSILALWESQPDQLVAFKDGPPLVVGIAEDQVFVVSDVQAAVASTNNFLYLQDREVVVVKRNSYQLYSAAGSKIERSPVRITWDAQAAEKLGFSHYMLKEIYEQPRAVSQAMAPHIDLQNETVRLSNLGWGVSPQNFASLDPLQDQKRTQEFLKNTEFLQIVACGTSYYAAMVGKYWIEKLARVPVEIDVASEFRYRRPLFPKNGAVISISQSGETADTLAAVRLAKENASPTLSICNVRNSSIDREADGHLYMNCGPEIGVASTKAFTSTLSVLHLLATALGVAKGVLSKEQEREQVRALLSLPSQMEAVLSYDLYFSSVSDALSDFRGFLYMGRGVSFPIALEGALKMKELAYLHAEGYAAGEMKHGPLALIDSAMAIVMLAPSDEHFEKTLSNLEEAKARGGKIISIGSGENARLQQVSDRYVALPESHWSTNPMLEVVPLQLMAFHLAKRLGHDVDQPRNLAKSVTVE